MERKFYQTLKEWKDNQIEIPLMIIGARQIGKTYLINQFCKENFKEYVYINLDLEEKIKMVFEQTLQPEEIIKNIELYKDIKINVEDTILFFDEIQVSERAITSLKYFCEHALPYKIICAGSLLGVKLNRFRSSFPVGKVLIRNMYPMDFEEFLLALKKDMWVEAIKESYQTLEPLIIHDKLIELYRYYLCIGGMPACVKEFIKKNTDIMLYNPIELQSIISSYITDMGKYTTNSSETVKIKTVYNSIPKQLGKEDKKFRYSLLKEGATKSSYESAIDWLVSSKMVYKCNLLNKIEIPLKPYENTEKFKLYFSDTGIFTELSQIAYRDIMLNLDMMFKGVIAENYIAIQLATNNIPLYYWQSGNKAEIAFVLYNEDGIIPVEVKASDNTQSKSLKVYMEKYNPKYAIRVSTKNFGFTNGIKSIPLYAAFCIK